MVLPAFAPSVPLHHQIQSVLRARIDSGEWAPGERVPTEDALVRRFRVSRTTVREALRSLERDGLIARYRRRGTFVRRPTAGARSRRTITNLVMGYEAEVRVVKLETVRAPSGVADLLGVARGDSVRRLVRVEVIDGAPLCVIVNHLRVSVGRHVRAADLRRHTLIEFLRDHLEIPLGVMRMTIEARMPDDEVAGLLGVDLTRPLLVFRLVVFDTQGRPVEVSDTFYRADRYRYEMEIPVPGRGQVIPGQRIGATGEPLAPRLLSGLDGTGRGSRMPSRRERRNPGRSPRIQSTQGGEHG